MCKQQLHQVTDTYTLKASSEVVTNTSIAEAAARKLQKPEQAYLLINFIHSNFQTPHPIFSLCRLTMVLENQTKTVELDCLDTQEAFQEWVQNKQDLRNFLEKNPDRFHETKIQCQSATVYEEIQAGKLWYLDNFHKNHFEVFNKTTGKHQGEADLEGNLIPGTRDPNKTFKL